MYFLNFLFIQFVVNQEKMKQHSLIKDHICGVKNIKLQTPRVSGAGLLRPDSPTHNLQDNKN